MIQPSSTEEIEVDAIDLTFAAVGARPADAINRLIVDWVAKR